MATDPDRRLANNEWLSQFPEALRRRVIGAVVAKSYPPGAAIHLKGDRPDGFYCVMGGQVDIGLIAPLRADIRLVRIGPQEWFGEDAALDWAPRASDAIAADSVELARLPMGVIRELCEAEPDFYKALVRLLCRRFRQSLEGIDDLFALKPH